MPYKPLSPCAYPGCIGLAADGERYCAAHKPAMQKYEQDRRGTPAQRGYGARWQRLRLLVLGRDPICQYPGCTELATDVDHIVPRSLGGKDSMDNLQGLCHQHHSAKTAREDGGFGNPRGASIPHNPRR